MRVAPDRAVDVTVLVPLRDEEANVDLLLAELVPALEASGRLFEVVLIDDGSADETFRRAAEAQRRDSRIRVIKFTRNFGQSAAFTAGFAAARGRFVVTCDGDLQNDPADIAPLLSAAETADVVCGWRRNRQDALITRQWPSMAANWLIGLIGGVPLHDNGCSLKVFRAEVVTPLQLEPGMHRYLPAIASQVGNRVREVVVNHRPRRFGRSKYGLSRTFRVLADLVQLRAVMRRALDRPAGAPPIYEVAETRPPGLLH
jgi:glycosyltransferase involved in cell wall biosynthesis